MAHTCAQTARGWGSEFDRPARRRHHGESRGAGGGDRSDAERSTRILGGVSAVAAGGSVALALNAADGTVRAWGSGSLLGNGGRPAINGTPVQVSILAGVEQIAAGAIQSLARKSGTVWAWGANNLGQLGDGTLIPRFVPVQVKDASGTGYLAGVTAVDTTNVSSLAVLSDGSVMAWGLNSTAQLCDGTKTNRALPVQMKNDSDPSGYLTGVIAVATGAGFSLALRSDGTVWACGANGNGQLGDGTVIERLTAVQVKEPADASGFLTGVAAIAAGNGFSLALMGDGTVRAWGGGTGGQLGDGALASSPLPVQVADPTDASGLLTDVRALAAGGTHALAIKKRDLPLCGDGETEGRVVAWGLNDVGQLGDGSEPNALTPVRVQFD